MRSVLAAHREGLVSEMENLLAAPVQVQQLSLGSFFEDWIANLELVPRPKLVL